MSGDGFCEWPISAWGYGPDGHAEERVRTCGRGAPRHPYGLNLCWQHEEKHVRDITDRLARGVLSREAHQHLAQAVIDAGLSTRAASTHPEYQDAIDREIVRRIEADNLAPSVVDAVDALIDRRLAERFGGAA